MTDSKKTGKTFSVTEGVTALRRDVDELKSRVSAMEVEVRLLKDVIRVAIPSINVRLSIPTFAFFKSMIVGMAPISASLQ